VSDPVKQLPANTVAGLAKMNEGKLTTERQKEIALEAVELLGDGMKLRDLAARYGVSRGRVTQLMLEYCPEQWKKAKTSCNIVRYDEAQEDLDADKENRDGLTLAYARERARYAHLMLQSTRRDIFGQEAAQINVHGDGIKIELVSYNTLDVVPETK
jgi:hypothetical protein